MPNLWQKSSGSKKKKWLIKKNKNVLFHTLNTILKKTVENCSAEAQTFKLTIQKKPQSLVKLPKSPLHIKNEELSCFLDKIFSKAERFPPKKENEKAFSLGKDTKFFFCAPI